MSLEKTAKTVMQKVNDIRDMASSLQHLAELILMKHTLNGDTFQFSVEDKEKLIQHYQARKAELQALVDELP